MSVTRERSTIFKFFYIVLSIITFPIFALIYILKHPFWVLFFLLLIVGGIAYYPMSQGVDISNVAEWYKKKYEDTRLELVNKAIESGKSQYVPKVILDDVKKIKEELEVEKEESLRVKSENYNDKIVRDDEFEEIAVSVKKKGGFKKKVAEEVKTEEVVTEEVKTEEVAPEVVTEEVKAEEVISKVVAEEVKTEEVTPEVVVEEVKAEEVTTEVVTDEVKTEEVAPEVVTEEAKTEEVTPEVVTEGAKTEEVTPEVVTEEAKTEEVVSKVVAEEVKAEEVTTEVVTEDTSEVDVEIE